MFGPRAPTFPVIGCRSAGKLTSQSLTTTQIAPPRRPQDSRTMTTIRVVVSVRDPNFPWQRHFRFPLPIFLKKINWWLTTDEGRWGRIRPRTRARGAPWPTLACGLATESLGLVSTSTGREVLTRDRGSSAGVQWQHQSGPENACGM